MDVTSFILLKLLHRDSFFVGRAKGSSGHGKALNFAKETFRREEVNVLSDSDVAMTMKNWDNLLLKVFDGDSVHVIGTQYEGIGGYASKDAVQQSYKGLPTATWMAFRPGTNLNNLDFMPDKENRIAIEVERLGSIFGIPEGFELLRDVGWQIPKFLIDNGLNYQVFEIVKPSSPDAVVLQGVLDYHDEFHYGGKPILIHQRGSMKHRFRKSRFSESFYNSLEKYYAANGISFMPRERSVRLKLLQMCIESITLLQFSVLKTRRCTMTMIRSSRTLSKWLS
jgi:hypothetical protein